MKYLSVWFLVINGVRLARFVDYNTICDFRDGNNNDRLSQRFADNQIKKGNNG